MIHLDLRSKRYGDQPVLGELSVSITQGESLALLGPSGIGKTTLLNILCGLDTDYDGTLSGSPKIAVAFQEPRLLAWRSAMDNLQLVTGCDHDTAVAAMSDMKLEGKEQHFPGQLSLGQQRRLSLARAFAANPDLLVLDEPFASLDAVLVDEMLTLTARTAKARHTALLLVTHAKPEADHLAEKQYLLSGKPATLFVL